MENIISYDRLIRQHIRKNIDLLFLSEIKYQDWRIHWTGIRHRLLYQIGYDLKHKIQWNYWAPICLEIRTRIERW